MPGELSVKNANGKESLKKCILKPVNNRLRNQSGHRHEGQGECMGRKKKDTLEFRYYEVPQNEPLLALLGEEWIRIYGREKVHLHFHNMMEIGVCRDGYGVMEFNETVIPYEPGMFTVIPKNYPHTTTSAEGEKSYWEYLFFDPEASLRQMYPNNGVLQTRLLERVNRSHIFESMDRSQNIGNLLWTIMEEMRKKEEFYRDSVEFMLWSLVLELARMNKDEELELILQERPGIMQISTALHYISNHYEEAIKVETLSNMCGLSETHFRRLFESYMNMTPVEYINMVRIQMACEIMKKTVCSMDEVAIKSGFSATCTFNRNFKRIVGVTPYQWKKDPQNYESQLMQFHISARKGW